MPRRGELVSTDDDNLISGKVRASSAIAGDTPYALGVKLLDVGGNIVGMASSSLSGLGNGVNINYNSSPHGIFNEALNDLADVDKLRVARSLELGAQQMHSMNSELERTKQEYLSEHPDGEGLQEAISAKLEQGLEVTSSTVQYALGNLALEYGKATVPAVNNFMTKNLEELKTSWLDNAYKTELATKQQYSINSAQQIVNDNIMRIEGAPDKYDQCVSELNTVVEGLRITLGETAASKFLQENTSKFELAYGKGLINQNATAFLTLSKNGAYSDKIRPAILDGLQLYAKDMAKKQEREMAHDALQALHMKNAQSHALANELILKNQMQAGSISKYDVYSDPHLTTVDKIHVIKEIERTTKQESKNSILDTEINHMLLSRQGVGTFSAEIQSAILDDYTPPRSDNLAGKLPPTYRDMVITASTIGCTKVNRSFVDRLTNALLHSNLKTEAGIRDFNEAKDALIEAKNLNSPILGSLTNNDDLQMINYLTEKFDEENTTYVTNETVQEVRDQLLENYNQYKINQRLPYSSKFNNELNIVTNPKTHQKEFSNEDYNKAFSTLVSDLKEEGIDITSDKAMEWQDEFRETIKKNHDVWVTKFGVSEEETLKLSTQSFKRAIRNTCLFDGEVMRHSIEQQLPGMTNTQYQLRWYAVAEKVNTYLTNTTPIQHGYLLKGLKGGKPIIKETFLNEWVRAKIEDDDFAGYSKVKETIPYNLAYQEPVFLLEKDGKKYEAKLRFEFDVNSRENVFYFKLKNKYNLPEKVYLYQKNGRPLSAKFDNPLIQKHVEQKFYKQQVTDIDVKQTMSEQTSSEQTMSEVSEDDDWIREAEEYEK